MLTDSVPQFESLYLVGEVLWSYSQSWKSLLQVKWLRKALLLLNAFEDLLLYRCLHELNYNRK